MTLLPQLSASVPHATPLQGFVLVQPHVLATPPPPQVFLPVHAAVPQSTALPQLSLVMPHWTRPHVVAIPSGMHAHLPVASHP
jgi:hypothetical protein